MNSTRSYNEGLAAWKIGVRNTHACVKGCTVHSNVLMHTNVHTMCAEKTWVLDAHYRTISEVSGGNPKRELENLGVTSLIWERQQPT